MADAFLRGAADAGHQVCKASLRGRQIRFCDGCLLCQSAGACTIADDLTPVLEDMRRSDAVVFATPLYFQDISGQLKALLDRSTSLYFNDCQIRDVYLLVSFSDSDAAFADHAEKSVKNWAAAFQKIRFAGAVRGCGLDRAGDFQKAPSFLEAAYQLGRQA